MPSRRRVRRDASPFLRGVARVIDIGGVMVDEDRERRSSARKSVAYALASDWRRVGGDIRFAAAHCMQEAAPYTSSKPLATKVKASKVARKSRMAKQGAPMISAREQ